MLRKSKTSQHVPLAGKGTEPWTSPRALWEPNSATSTKAPDATPCCRDPCACTASTQAKWGSTSWGYKNVKLALCSSPGPLHCNSGNQDHLSYLPAIQKEGSKHLTLLWKTKLAERAWCILISTSLLLSVLTSRKRHCECFCLASSTQSQ